jgi:fibronectin-binding autotransporter adhesin
VTLNNQLVLSGQTAIDTLQNTKAILTKSIDAAAGKTAILTKKGSGELQLNAASTYAGGTIVENGVLTVANNLALGTGTVQLDNGTTLQSAAANVALDNKVNVGGNSGVNNGELVTLSTPTSTSLTLNNQVSGDAGIVKTGIGKLTLNGQNTYQGATTINEGTVVINSANALGSNNAVTLQAGATLETSQAISQLTKDIQLKAGTATEAVLNIANGDVVLTGQLSGDAGLVKRGSSVLELSNTNNSYQGKTIIEAGALAISNAQNLGNKIAVELSGGDLKLLNSITIGNGDSIKVTGTKGAIDTVSGTTSALGVALEGTGQFIKKGEGSLILSGQNQDFVGGIAVAAGTLSVSADNNLGKSDTTLTLDGGILNTTGAMTLARDVVLNADSTIKNSSIVSVNRLMGDHKLTLEDGFFDLQADATHTNAHLGTVLKNTTVSIASDADLGQAMGQLDFVGNSTLQAQGQINSTRAVSLIGVSNTLDTNNNTVSLGSLSGNGDFKKAGDGDLVLSNDSSAYSGSFEVASGQVVVGNSQALGLGSVAFDNATSLKTSTNVNLANDITLNGKLSIHAQSFNSTLSGNVTGTGSLVKDGIGQLSLSQDNSYSGGTTVTEGKVAIDANAALGSGQASFANNTELSLGISKGVSVANTLQLDGQVKVHSGSFDSSLATVTGTGSLVKDGVGQLTLSKDNSYSGGTTVTEGKVAIDANAALGSGQASFANNTELSLGVSKGVSVANTLQLDGQVKVHSGSFDSSLATVTGTGSLVKDGVGQLSLSQDNSYSGGTTVTEGKVAIDANAALGSGQASFANNTELSLGVSKGVSVANTLQLDGQVKVHSGSFDSSLATVTGTGSLVKDGVGQLTLSKDNSYSGGTTVTEGKVAIDANAALGSGQASFANNTELSLGVSKGVSVANTLQLDGQVKVHSGSFDSSLATVTGTGSLVKDGVGQLSLSQDNSYSGGTTVTEGKVAIDANAALGSGQASFANNTELSLGVSKGVSVANTLQLDGQVKVHSGSFDSSLATVTGTGSLVKDGVGQLSLSQDNSYSGGTTVTEGKVAIDANAALGSGQASFANNTELSLGVSKGVSVANTLQLDGQVKVHSGSFDSSLATVTGTGSLVKDGVGQLSLSQDNSYSGGTTVTEGKVAIDANAALGSGQASFANNTELSLGISKGVSVANTLQLDGQVKVHSGSFDSSLATVTGTGSLVKDGVGQLSLSQDNSYSGGTTVTEGKVAIDANAALGSGQASFANNTELSLGISKGVSVANTLQLDGQVKVHSGSFDSSLATVTGTGSLVKDGVGQLSLSQDNSYSGGTTVTEGKVAIDANAALGSGQASFANNTELSLGISKGVSVANTLQLDGQVKVHSGSFDSSLATVTGTGSLVKDGVGQLSLSQDNSYSGGTTVTEGKVAIDANAALGSGQASFANNTELSLGVSKGVSVANTLQLDGQVKVHSGSFDSSLATVTGTGSLVKDGIGQLSLSQDNSYSGGTTVTEGKVTLGANKALGTGKLDLLAGTTLENNKSIVLNNQIALTGVSKNITVNTIDSTAITLAQTISGNGNLAKEGAGTLILQGVNSSYQGNIVVNKGKIIAANNDALGVGIFTLETGKSSDLVLELGSNVSQLNNQFVLHGDNNDVTKTDRFELNIAQGQNANLMGKISGDAGILKTGLGTLTLSGANSYQGDTNIDKGKLIVNSSSALGQATSSLILQGGTELELSVNVPFLENNIQLKGSTTIQTLRDTLLNGVISDSGSITKKGSGTLTLNRNNTYTGQTLIYDGVVAIKENQSLGKNNSVVFKTDGTQLHALSTVTALANDLVLERNAQLEVDGVTTLSSNVTGVGHLTKSGTGTLILNHNNQDYMGNIIVDSGKLSISTSESLGKGAELDLKASSTLQVTSSLVLDKDVVLVGDGNTNTTTDVVNLLVADSQTAQFTKQLTGDAGLIKQGLGTVILTQDNSYSGGTTVTEGKVAVDANAALGSGQATFANNTELSLGISKGVNVANTLQLDGQVKVHSGSFNSSLVTVTGTGSLVKDGVGQLSLSQDNSYSGGTQVKEGTIAIGANHALGNGLVVFEANTALVTNNALNLANDLQILGSTQFKTNEFESGLNGELSGSGSLTKLGTGTLVFNNANTNYTGDLNVQEGGVVVTENDALGLGALTLKYSTSLTNQGTNTLNNNRLILQGDGDANTATDIVNIVVDANGALSLQSTLEGDANLVKSGSGVLRLEKASTSYTGGIAVNSGTISIGHESALGTGSVTLASDTTLLSTADTATVKNRLNLLGQVSIETDKSLTLDALGVAGVGDLIKTGVGTLTIKSNNTYAGNTTIEQGTVVAASASAFSTGNVITKQGTTLELQQNIANALRVDGETTLSTNATYTLSGVVTGNGNLVKDGTGTITLSANNANYQGDIMVKAGTLAAQSNTSLGINKVSLSQNTVLQTSQSLNLTNNIELLGNAIINSAANNSTLLGVISGAGTLTKTGTGSLTLEGNNSGYQSNINVNAGVLLASSDANLGDVTLQKLVLNNGTFKSLTDQSYAHNILLSGTSGVLDTNGHTVTWTGVIDGVASGLTKVGDGTLVLAADNTYGGVTSINAGTLVVNKASNLGTNANIEIGNATLHSMADLDLQNVVLRGASKFLNDGDFNINGVVSGSGALVKQGAGQLVLSGINTYSGGTTLDAGTLVLTNGDSLGVGGLTVKSGQVKLENGFVSSQSLIQKSLDTNTLITGNGKFANTIVEEGLLLVDGVLTSPITVGSKGDEPCDLCRKRTKCFSVTANIT